MQEKHTTKAALLASGSDSPACQMNDVYDMLAEVRDLIHVVEMASDKLSRMDGSAFLTILDVTQGRLKRAMDQMKELEGWAG